jgi:hypothetical protein
MLGWDRYKLHKNCAGTHYVNTLFLHLVGFACHVVHSGASGARNIDTLFFMLEWDQYGFNKKCIGTCYAELLFLHPAGSTGHVVHFVRPGSEWPTHYFSSSGGTGTDLTKSALGHIMLNLCFRIWWDLWVR